MYSEKAWAVAGPITRFAATTIPRRDPGERDVQIEVLFCGICHSDLHTARNEWSEAAETVYQLLDAGKLEARKMPEPGKLVDGTLAYFIRPGKHSMTPEDWKVFLDYADGRFQRGRKE